MKKINSLIISLLCLFAFNANAQQTDSYPKGRYDEIKVDTKNYESTRSVYSADANKLASDWAYNGFSLQAQKGIPVFETGKYQLNAQLSAVSPDITLPAIQNGKLILSLDASFETEFRYDWIRITVKADGKETLVYNKTGSAGRAVDNTIDLTKFAGKTIQLQLYLSADDTKQGKGWTIYHLDIFSTGSIISTLRRGGGTASDIDDIEIISVKSDGFPDEIIVEFTVKDQDSEFISGLELADFTFLDNLLGNIACQNLREPSPVLRPKIDIIFIVDNSGSMGSHINQVKTNMERLVNNLGANFDLRAGLMRYGYANPWTSLPCPNLNFSVEYSTIGDNESLWYMDPNSTNHGLSEFIDLIWNKNITSGGYEPTYEAITYMANTPTAYRSNTQKVFIVLGDEPIHDGYNQYDCNRNITHTLNSTIATLNNNGIQTFMITAPGQSRTEFEPIAQATGGEWIDIYSPDYDQVMSKIASTVGDRYIFSYCMNTNYDYVEVDSICRPFVVASALDNQIADTLCYIPQKMGSITRTNATQLLDNVALQPNVSQQVGVIVCPPGNSVSVDSVVLRYKQRNAPTFTSIRIPSGTANGDGCYTYNTTIPGSDIQAPNVEYKFDAYLSNRTLITSPASHGSYNTWTLTVLPNRPPAISNITVSPVRDCDEVKVCAKIVDNTDFLVKKELHYRIQKTSSSYIKIDMQVCTNCGGSDMYCAEIPRNAVDNAGLFYYIYAQDNHGSQGWSGSPESPLQLTVPQVSPSTSNPMSIYVGIQSVSIFCEMIQIGDKISTYFQNECGNYQLGGSVTYSAGDAIMGMIIVPAYGDSDPNDGYKDGFEDNDEVQVRLERNGYEYILQFPYPVVYHPNYGNVMTRPIYGPGVPDITINYNGNGINAGSIQTSTANGTDFGEKSAAVTHTFTVQNVGCEDMVINGGTVDDAENFSIAAPYAIVPPNGTYTFTVTYNAEETATTMVNLLNSASPSSYRFTVTGQAAGGSNFDCEMEISPNPVPSYGANIAFTLPELTTLTAKVLTISGTTVRTFFGPIMMGAGRHSLYLQPYDLIPGQSYIISVETNSGVCSKIFMVSQ